MNNIYISNSLITNFKPKLKNFSNLKLFKKKKNYQIFCKNFFLFLLLLKYNQNNKKIFKKSTVFVKPYIKNVFTVLRSPYRHKLTRHQFILSRYNIVSSMTINSDKIEINNFKRLIKIFYSIEDLNFWFESNVVSNHRFKFSLKFVYKFNFLLKNFKSNNK